MLDCSVEIRNQTLSLRIYMDLCKIKKYQISLIAFMKVWLRINIRNAIFADNNERNNRTRIQEILKANE